jgi:2-polyprenyl-3-methyl-5-hydroxy-6-metoxy-1,4-benzoquinol methylase
MVLGITTMKEDEIPTLTTLRSNSRLRNFIRKIPRLRETLYLLSELRTLLRYRPARARADTARDYESRPDPWGYSTPWGTEHLRIVREILDRAVPNHFGSALDVGCGEGWITEAVASRCDCLLGVDIVSIALDRAKDRCRSLPHVQFADWDLQRDPALGIFDLIILTGVMECFRSASEFRNARDKIVGMLAPGSQLLVTTTHQSDAFDRAWWCRWLPRGGQKIEEYLARGPYLEITDTVLSKTHRFTLYRRRIGLIDEASSARK